MDPRSHNAKVNKRESKFQKKLLKKSRKKKNKIQKKKLKKKTTWPGPNLARPDPTWPTPTNLPETKTFQFCKKSSSGDNVQNFCTNISLRNRGKVFPYKKKDVSREIDPKI